MRDKPDDSTSFIDGISVYGECYGAVPSAQHDDAPTLTHTGQEDDRNGAVCTLPQGRELRLTGGA